MAAISISARDQFGESQYLSKYSNQLVELMRPVALQANKELYSDTYQAIAAQAQALVSSGELDESEVQNYVNDAFNLYMNPTKALQSGSVSDKMSTIKAIQNGGIDDPTAYLSGIVDTARYADQVSGGSTIAKGAIEGAWGTRSFRLRNTGKAGETDKSLSKYENKTLNQLQDIYDNQVKNADDFNTTTDQWSKWFENATTWIGDIKTAIGDKMWKVGEVIIEGIATYLGGKFLLHLAGSALGKAVTGTASAVGGAGAVSGATASGGSILAGAGGVAISAVAISALALAIGSVVADKMWDSSGEHGKEVAEEELKGTVYENNSTAKSLMAVVHAQNDAGGFQKTFGNVGAGISMGFSNIFQGKADKNKNFLQWAIQSGALGDDKTDDTQQFGRLLALAMMYAQNGYLDAFNKGLQEAGIDVSIKSKEDIGELIREAGITKETIESYASMLIKSGWGKINTEDGTLESFSVDGKQFGLEGVLGYRNGLAEVPYDNYVASLHEGEAVLTASTANELRNLLDEYRANNESMASLDAIVQQQTSDLCAKIDEVINTVSALQVNGYITSSAVDQSTARGLLKSSMIHMRSTKDALN